MGSGSNCLGSEMLFNTAQLKVRACPHFSRMSIGEIRWLHKV